MAVVVVHACDELAEGAADELLAVRAGPDEVRGGADQAADGQAQRELLSGAERQGGTLERAAARQGEPQGCIAESADQGEGKLLHGGRLSKLPGR